MSLPLTKKQKSFFLKLAEEALPMTLRWAEQRIKLTKEILEKIILKESARPE